MVATYQTLASLYRNSLAAISPVGMQYASGKQSVRTSVGGTGRPSARPDSFVLGPDG